MPIDIRRFGVGHRRPDGPPGTTGVSGQVIHSDRRGTVTELAFRRGGRLEPHANPNTSWLIVIEGGGWVGIDGERTRIAAGEAVLFPPDVPHAAWTEHSEMRAFMVEFSGSDDAALPDGAVELLADVATGPVHPRPVEPDAGEPA
jgi:quercetin dioxygenase-like cupin family protein